jgi:hypothetical protein
MTDILKAWLNQELELGVSNVEKASRAMQDTKACKGSKPEESKTNAVPMLTVYRTSRMGSSGAICSPGSTCSLIFITSSRIDACQMQWSITTLDCR